MEGFPSLDYVLIIAHSVGLVKGLLTSRSSGGSVPLGTIIVYYKGRILSIDRMHKVSADFLGKSHKRTAGQIWSKKMPGLLLTRILRVAPGNAQTKKKAPLARGVSQSWHFVKDFLPVGQGILLPCHHEIGLALFRGLNDLAFRFQHPHEG